MQTINKIQAEIEKLGDRDKAVFLKRFFKTGKGEYGEGDEFAGLTVPQSRSIAKKYSQISLDGVDILLQSRFHEERLIGVFILVYKFKLSDQEKQKDIYDFYLSHTDRMNNWDLVDSSAYHIVGEYLLKHTQNIEVLKKLARSKRLWDTRIAMIATYQFIKAGNPKPTFEIAKILIGDKEDLIQKAVGWMLREVGNRCSQEIEEEFLQTYYKTMHRTALRYAIEKFSPEKRRDYLLGKRK